MPNRIGPKPNATPSRINPHDAVALSAKRLNKALRYLGTAQKAASTSSSRHQNGIKTGHKQLRDAIKSAEEKGILEDVLNQSSDVDNSSIKDELKKVFDEAAEKDQEKYKITSGFALIVPNPMAQSGASSADVAKNMDAAKAGKPVGAQDPIEFRKNEANVRPGSAGTHDEMRVAKQLASAVNDNVESVREKMRPKELRGITGLYSALEEKISALPNDTEWKSDALKDIAELKESRRKDTMGLAIALNDVQHVAPKLVPLLNRLSPTDRAEVQKTVLDDARNYAEYMSQKFPDAPPEQFHALGEALVSLSRGDEESFKTQYYKATAFEFSAMKDAKVNTELKSELEAVLSHGPENTSKTTKSTPSVTPPGAADVIKAIKNRDLGSAQKQASAMKKADAKETVGFGEELIGRLPPALQDKARAFDAAKQRYADKSDEKYNEIIGLLHSGLPIELVIFMVMAAFNELFEEKFKMKTEEMAFAEAYERAREMGKNDDAKEAQTRSLNMMIENRGQDEVRLIVDGLPDESKNKVHTNWHNQADIKLAEFSTKNEDLLAQMKSDDPATVGAAKIEFGAKAKEFFSREGNEFIADDYKVDSRFVGADEAKVQRNQLMKDLKEAHDPSEALAQAKEKLHTNPPKPSNDKKPSILEEFAALSQKHQQENEDIKDSKGMPDLGMKSTAQLINEQRLLGEQMRQMSDMLIAVSSIFTRMADNIIQKIR